MRTNRLWQVVLLLAAVATMLTLASGGAAMSAATFTVSTEGQLNAALAALNPGDTIVLNPHRFFTADAAVPANGFEVLVPNVTIRGKTNSSGGCTNTTTTIVDGDNKPVSGTPGHVGPGWTVEADNVQFKCFRVQFGTAGIVSDGFNGLNVNNMSFVSNGRDLTVGAPDGDAIWVQDGNNVKVNGSTFSGMGFDGIESDIGVNASNDGWRVKKNTFTGVHNSCIDMTFTTNAIVGELVSGKPSNGNTCTVSGSLGTTDAIVVDDQGVGGPNQIYANTVANAWLRCFFVGGDFAKFLSNTCVTSHNGEGASLNGDNITADLFTTTLSSGGTNGDCVDATGDNLKLTNTKCGSTRDHGIEVHGLNAVVTNAQVRQSQNSCFNSDGDNQVWTNVTCNQVTGTDPDDYGVYANGLGSKFTTATIGDTYTDCFFADNDNQVYTTIKCHGSSAGYGIEANGDSIMVNGFEMGSTSNGCAVAVIGTGTNATFKNGHCKRVLSDEAVYGYDDNLKVDKVTVDAAYGDCFAHYSGTDGSLTNSIGTNCGIGDSSDGGIEWDSDGTNTISGNDLGQTTSYGLYVSVTGGDYLVTNNKFHDAQLTSCVYVHTPDNLTLTGNKAQQCYDSAYDLDVNLDPIVNSNNGTDASGISNSPSPTMLLVCETTCSGGQVKTNVLDGGGNEQQGLLVTNNAGCPGLTISGNKITNMQGTGLEVDGAGCNTLATNTVANASDVDDLFGIFLNSDDNDLSGSTVTGGFDNGIEVGGDSNNVHNNVNVHDNGEDGIHVSGTNALITSNKTTNNSGEGLEDDGAGTTLTNNSSSGNRQDCAGTDATFVDGGGNACADGSFFTDAGVITAPVRKHHLTH